MGKLKVLIIHTFYQIKGGEEGVVENEMKLLNDSTNLELLSFDNSTRTFGKLCLYPFNPFSYKKLISKINHFNPDIIHIHNLHFAGSPFVIWAAKRKKVPVVVTLHNYRLVCPSGLLTYNHKLFTESIKANFPWYAVFKGVYKNSQLITFWVAFTIWLHKKLGTWHKVDKYILLNRTSLIPFAKREFITRNYVVKPNFFDNNIFNTEPREPFYLFVGRLSEEKGIEILLDTWKDIPQTLFIIGDGPLKEKVIDKANNYSNIKYLGFRNKEFIVDQLRKCSALVFPSVCYENMPLSIIEAFSCGTPVIASDTGGPSEMVKPGNNGLLFKTDDKVDLLQKIIYWNRLSINEKVLFSKNARKSYEDNYTSEINKKQLLSIYESAIQSKKD
jgi:glycosyltransferase involved in cell wall biosynthesis